MSTLSRFVLALAFIAPVAVSASTIVGPGANCDGIDLVCDTGYACVSSGGGENICEPRVTPGSTRTGGVGDSCLNTVTRMPDDSLCATNNYCNPENTQCESRTSASPTGFTGTGQNGRTLTPQGSGLAPTGAGAINMRWIEGYKNDFVNVINNYLVPALMALALIVFFWGIYKAFIWNGASESDKGEGKKFAMWGIIGFVIILSVWGLVAIVKDTLVPNAQNTAPKTPTL